MQVAILGRQPQISIAEIESLFGANNIIKLLSNIVAVSTTEALPQSRMGGTMKSGTVITTLKNKNIDNAYEYIMNQILELANHIAPEGKIQLGVSVYGKKYPTKEMLKLNLEIKRVLKQAGRSVRIIENRHQFLETAQVLHNKLTGERGIEILIIASGRDILIARTTGVQDIDAYSKRDQGRPMRDAKVGMLPPKLAQVIINLSSPNQETTIIDPFCGTGVLLQEALLMGFDVIGTDLDPRMIEYTTKNLQWLNSKYDLKQSVSAIEDKISVGDAQLHIWEQLKQPSPSDNYRIACETYLGKPLSSLPPKHLLDQIMLECDTLLKKFLINIGKQIAPNTKLCLAVPAWKAPDRFLHLKTLANLKDLGYTRVSFVHSANQGLIYHRPDQIVARELVVLEKIRE